MIFLHTAYYRRIERKNVMKITFNQERIDLPQESRVIDLLQSQGFSRNTAVWVNNKRLLQQEYAVRRLQDGDQVRVLRPLGGG
jgi:thiamine biosynthesis protein ThiS